jgi:hypothetical protein
MRKFWIILKLLLCLTVPVSGWASVQVGFACPQHDQQGLGEAAHHGRHSSEQLVASVGGSGHRHDDCAGIAGHGKPCSGDHCTCGCGFGACASSALPLLAPQPFALTAFAGTHAVPSMDEPSHALFRGTSPLRPPIS